MLHAFKFLFFVKKYNSKQKRIWTSLTMKAYFYAIKTVPTDFNTKDKYCKQKTCKKYF